MLSSLLLAMVATFAGCLTFAIVFLFDLRLESGVLPVLFSNRRERRLTVRRLRGPVLFGRGDTAERCSLSLPLASVVLSLGAP